MIKLNKIVTSIIIFVFGLIIFFIDQKLFANLKVAPNLFLIYLTFIFVNTNFKISFIFGAFYLLIIETFLNINFIPSMTSMYIALITLELFKMSLLKKGNIINEVILVSISTIIFETIRTLIQNKFINIDFLNILFLEMIFNLLIVLILYDMIKPFREKLNETFSKSNILTRYF